MKKVFYYILIWFDEGETNRSETVWEGYDPKEARRRFNKIELSGKKFFAEVWERVDGLDDSRLDYKTI